MPYQKCKEEQVYGNPYVSLNSTNDRNFELVLIDYYFTHRQQSQLLNQKKFL
jgi:hypothetical protein